MRLLYLCHFGALSGYAQAAHDYLAALDEHDIYADIQIQVQPLEQVGDALPARFEGLRELLADPGWERPDIAIVHAPPRQLERFDRRRVDFPVLAMTTWETCNWPQRWKDILESNYDGVIVPSAFCADGLAGLGVPVHVLPHCFDPDWWLFDGPPATEDRYTFYTVGVWSARKNPLGVLRAYLHEFTAADQVRLVMCGPNPDVAGARALIARSGLQMDQLPALVVHPEPLTDEQLLELHREAHCFVSATRGEGWGLGLFEAAVMGRAIVAPTFGGQRDFYDQVTAGMWWLVDHQLTPAFPDVRTTTEVGQVGIAVAEAPTGLTARDTWADPDICHIAYGMRSFYEAWQNPTRAHRQTLQANFGYAAVAAKLHDILLGALR